MYVCMRVVVVVGVKGGVKGGKEKGQDLTQAKNEKKSEVGWLVDMGKETKRLSIILKKTTEKRKRKRYGVRL